MRPRGEIIIEAGHTGRKYFRDIWRYRELFYILSWRDIKVRYKQTVIGILWALLKPALTLLVFTVVFGRIAGLPSDAGVPYPILVLSGLLPWQFFSRAVLESSGSLIGNERLITKVYFPRIIIPASAVITTLVDFAITLLILFALMGYYRFLPSWPMVLLPAMLLAVAILAFGAGLIFAALNVRYRDFRYIVPFLLQFGIYISPVGFSSNVVPEAWQPLFAANPMVGIIDGFRWCIAGSLGSAFPIYRFFLAGGESLVIFFLALWFFRSTERYFADVI